MDRASFEETRAAVAETLLDARSRGGHWEGELSSSSLPTAVAVLALAFYDRARASHGASLDSLVRGGLAWLVRHQNPDGGFGDTISSSSNVSTTMLVWAALAMERAPGPEIAAAAAAAERWLERFAGSLEPGTLARTIVERYGKDRTFSVPILTVSALAGRLGPEPDAWRRVPQLPFELAALPQRWFQWLRLPVVSYALPALIALGLLRHGRLPGANPLIRFFRDSARPRTLDLLERIQPSSGGFLEAIPLTSFVVASLVASGEASHAVANRGVEFLTRSAREDGSWPIDTNLATWLTTLSVSALASAKDDTRWTVSDRESVREWLLGQQYREVHSYTQAAPGAWAWTDLPGGVPDADDTAGALLALRELDGAAKDSARAGLLWLVNLQNRDGGIPTFCRGWGTLPFDRSGADLTAHALRAWAAWRAELPDLEPRLRRAARRGLAYLEKNQRHDGAFVPLWFGNEKAPNEENPTYGTSRALLALAGVSDGESPRAAAMRARAIRFLLSARNDDGGWGGDRGVSSSIEETAFAVQGLARCRRLSGEEGLDEALSSGVSWLIERTGRGREFPPSPIGFYFAKLWYFEKLYPVIFTLAALNEVAQRAPGTRRPA